jgi:plastocyanin
MLKIITTLTLIITSILGLTQTTHTINTGSYYYSPNTLTIEAGDSIVWINDGGFHDVNGDVNSVTGQAYNNPETFDSPATNVVGAVIFAHKFNVAGNYSYDCSVGSHAANGMIGSFTVEDNTSNISETSMPFSSLSYNQISNCLHLKFNSLENNTSVQLHNLEGKLIQTQHVKFKPGLNEHIIPISSSLNSGIYIVSMINKGKKISKKILIN